MDDLTFQDELALSPVNVPRAALRFARAIAYPDLDVTHYMARLDELAASARGVVSLADSIAGRAEALADFLFQRSGFRGNEVEYSDPRNSYLNEVLDRRLGIPISLSVLYVAMAERLGLPAYGVGLPGHFIVGIRDAADTVLIDPFHAGVRLSPTDCARLVRETTGYDDPFNQAWLAPAAPGDVLARMLNNLRNVYIQSESWPQALAVIEHLRAVQPDVADHLRDYGVIQYRNGALRLAAQFLEEYLRREPNAPDADSVREGLRFVLERWARLN